jgi:hypothetical protein
LAGFFGGFGARIAAKRLPTEEVEINVSVNAGVNDVRASVSQVLCGMGRLSDDFDSENKRGSISAIVGSGHLNLNPTIVHVMFVESTQALTHVSIRAVAKEGLVKQHSAKKAAENIRNLLSNGHSEPDV